MDLMTAPHLDHDTGMNHSLGIIIAIAVIMLLIVILTSGGKDE